MCEDINKKKNDFELLIQEAKCDACQNSCPFSINTVGITAAKFLNSEENTPDIVLLADNKVVHAGLRS